LKRLSLEQHLRLSGTRHSYTLESPLSDAYADRVRIHYEGTRAMLALYARQRGGSVEAGIVPAGSTPGSTEGSSARGGS